MSIIRAELSQCGTLYSECESISVRVVGYVSAVVCQGVEYLQCGNCSYIEQARYIQWNGQQYSILEEGVIAPIDGGSIGIASNSGPTVATCRISCTIGKQGAIVVFECI